MDFQTFLQQFVNALSLGSVVLVGLPILVLLAAVIILLPRRNL